MASSCWDSYQQWEGGSDDIAAFDDPELQSLYDTWNADYSVNLNDLFFPPSCPETNNYYCCNSYSDFNNEFDSSFNFTKRQRLCSTSEEIYSSNFFDPACLTSPAVFSIGSVKKNEVTSGGCGGGGLSVQSMAARQRRRRISDKTRELGKLIPGGQKMNTAEMLDSARKYIKFMHAQLALLQSLASPHHQEVTFEGEEEFQKLLESPLVQEKLYSTENCLLPRKYAQQLGCEDK